MKKKPENWGLVQKCSTTKAQLRELAGFRRQLKRLCSGASVYDENHMALLVRLLPVYVKLVAQEQALLKELGIQENAARLTEGRRETGLSDEEWEALAAALEARNKQKSQE